MTDPRTGATPAYNRAATISMGDWLPRLPRQGAAGGGGKRIVKKQQRDDGGGGGGSSRNPFSRFNAPGTASESSDDELHALIHSEVRLRPPSPPPIPKRPGSTPNRTCAGCTYIYIYI